MGQGKLFRHLGELPHKIQLNYVIHALVNIRFTNHASLFFVLHTPHKTSLKNVGCAEQKNLMYMFKN